MVLTLLPPYALQYNYYMNCIIEITLSAMKIPDATNTRELTPDLTLRSADGCKIEMQIFRKQWGINPHAT